ncbi:MAG: MOSC domain-containing protein [Candidatus Heimdallarchaeaceae archaeon]
MQGIIKAVNISSKREIPKKNVGKCEITPFGLKGDAHAGKWKRQVSLLSEESRLKMIKRGYKFDYGELYENLTIEGIKIHKLPIGTWLKINTAILEIVQVGKPPTEYSPEEYEKKWVMLEEGVFAKVIRPGFVAIGDTIEVIERKVD